jgi:Arc/MetJ family transcription regulator
MIFQAIGEGRPYPNHGFGSTKDWLAVAPRQVRLDQLVTTRAHLDLHTLLSSDSTFFGDLFAHVVHWQGTYYLENGLHRALRAALQQRTVIHARVLDLDDPDHPRAGDTAAETAAPGTSAGSAHPTGAPPPPPPGPTRQPLADRRRPARRS